MGNKTTLARSIELVSEKEKYDAACKKILAEKIILAWIMKHTVKEYAKYTVQEIAEKYILGNAQISEVWIMPDETNAPRMAGTGVEDCSVYEGTIMFDIQFHAMIPSSNNNGVTKMIINVEAQDDFYPGYPIVKRGIYYCGRMISSQYGTVFTNSHYEKIQKVYSIWICTSPPAYRRNSITKYAVKEENIVGNVEEMEENYDLLTTILICLGKDSDCEKGKENQLLKLLDVLLSPEKNVVEKKNVLENEFHISMTEEMEGELKDMCNLSDGVERRGIEKGTLQTKKTLVKNMLKENISMDTICRVAECDEAFVEQVKSEM